jgi:AraC family transcriptional regulator
MLDKNLKSKHEYIARINRVQDFVKSNLDGDLSLDRLSAIACFSKFYFNRIFKAVAGESLNDYVNRARVEASAFTLMRSAHKPITTISYDKGFSSPAVFSRAFKAHYGLSPSQWRAAKIQKSNICKMDSNTCKDQRKSQLYINSLTQQPTWRINMTSNNPVKIEVINMPDIPIAYVRHKGAYNPLDKVLFQSLFSTLMAWAVPAGLFNPPLTKAMTVYSSGHPDITEPENLCVDACISIDQHVAVNGEIGKRVIPGGRYAVLKLHEARLEECAVAWSEMFDHWLLDSGYEPGEGAYYCSHLNDPEQHPEKLHSVEMYLPVKPLR